MFYRATPRLCLVLGLLALGLISAGCANQRAWPSGFLTHNADLQATGHGGDMAYVRPDVDWKAYRTAYIEPAEIHPTKPGAVDLTPQEQTELTAYLHDATVQALRGRFTIVDKPGPDSVRVRAAITEVGKGNPWINIPAWVVAYPVVYGGVTVEVEILDARTNQRLCAMLASRTGHLREFSGTFTWLGHARAGMDRCADRLRVTVDESASRPVLAGPVNPVSPAKPGKPEVAYVP